MLYDSQTRPPWFTEAASYWTGTPSRRRRIAVVLARTAAVIALVLLLSLS